MLTVEKMVKKVKVLFLPAFYLTVLLCMMSDRCIKSREVVHRGQAHRLWVDILSSTT